MSLHELYGNATPTGLKFPDNVLACPVCENVNVHIARVTVHRGQDKITIDGESVSVVAEENRSRGEIIAIEYWCEGGHHHGLIIFHFYKGNIETLHRHLSEYTAQEIREGKNTDIFRD